jgi:hypothetical protein
MTEDRRQMTEDRRQMTEFGMGNGNAWGREHSA